VFIVVLVVVYFVIDSGWKLLDTTSYFNPHVFVARCLIKLEVLLHGVVLPSPCSLPDMNIRANEVYKIAKYVRIRTASFHSCVSEEGDLLRVHVHCWLLLGI
jgi:hypothetical protein